MSAQPTWYQLINSCLSQEAPPVSRFLQLATLTVSGHPSCRTVVFRDWHHTPSTPTPSLLIATDSRSAKIDGLLKYPNAEACWYFLEARVQLRLTSRVACITSDERDAELASVRFKQWHALSPSAREGYATPHPGRPLGPQFTEEHKARVVHGEQPVDWFAVLMLTPERVDVVDLRANTRRLYEQHDDQQWVERFINR